MRLRAGRSEPKSALGRIRLACLVQSLIQTFQGNGIKLYAGPPTSQGMPRLFTVEQASRAACSLNPEKRAR
jgi:hypothetical protein